MWPEALTSLIQNLAAAERQNDASLLRLSAARERPWLKSDSLLVVPTTNSAQLHRAGVLRLKRLIDDVLVCLGQDGSLVCWNLSAGRLLPLEDGDVPTRFFQVTGATIFAGREDGGVVRYYDVANGWKPGGTVTRVELLQGRSAVRTLCVLESSLAIVYADGTVLLIEEPEKALALQRVRLLARLQSEPLTAKKLNAEKLTAKKLISHIVIGDRSGQVIVLGTDGSRALVSPEHKARGAVRSLAPLRDGLFASGHDSGEVCFWQWTPNEKGGRLERLQGEGNARSQRPSAVEQLFQFGSEAVVAAYRDGTIAYCSLKQGCTDLHRLPRPARGMARVGRNLFVHDGVSPVVKINCSNQESKIPEGWYAEATNALLVLLEPSRGSEEDAPHKLVYGSRTGVVSCQKQPSHDEPDAMPLWTTAQIRVNAQEKGVRIEQGEEGEAVQLFDLACRHGDRLQFRQPIACCHLDEHKLWLAFADGQVLNGRLIDGRLDRLTTAGKSPGKPLALVSVGEQVALIDVGGHVCWLGGPSAPRSPVDVLRGERPSAIKPVGSVLLLGDERGRVAAVTTSARPGSAVQATTGPVRHLLPLGSSRQDSGFFVAVGDRHLAVLRWTTDRKTPEVEPVLEPWPTPVVCSIEALACGDQSQRRLNPGCVDGDIGNTGTNQQQANSQRRLILGCVDGSVRVVRVDFNGADPSALAHEHEPAGSRRHMGAVTCLAMRADGVWATGGVDGVVLLWKRDDKPDDDAIHVHNGFVTYNSVVKLEWISARLFVGLLRKRAGEPDDSGWHLLSEESTAEK